MFHANLGQVVANELGSLEKEKLLVRGGGGAAHHRKPKNGALWGAGGK